MPFDSTLENTAAFNFPVEMTPLYWKDRGTDDASGHYAGSMHKIDPGDHQAVVRTDTQEVLGIHGSRYKLRPYAESVERVSECILEAAPNQPTQVRDEIIDRGAKMRRSIVFPNLKIQPQINDIVTFRVDLWNSYNGAWGDQYNVWAERLWCLNGCTDSAFSVRSSIKHVTIDWKHELHVENLKRAIEGFFGNEEKFRAWTTRPVNFLEAEKLFKRTLCHADKPHEPPEKQYIQPKLVKIMDIFDREPQSVWGAYNAATNWASHPETKGEVANVFRDRHNQVAKMLRSEPWKVLAGD